MGKESAKEWFHWFTAAVYFIPILGAIISDVWLGKFKTIIWFSLVYCVGFFILAWDHTRLGLAGGLALIAIGSGMIKPCVSANVGDQFGPSNKHLIERVYSWFYFSINVGAAVSMWLCPVLLDKYGPATGFGVPAIFMVIATIAYVLGRRKLVDVPPAGKLDWAETLDWEQGITLIKLCIIFLLFLPMFFALYYQSQSAWVLQAEKMNLRWAWITWLPAQMQVANSILILVMIPAFSYGIYPALSRIGAMTPLRKMMIGMFVTAGCFLVPIWIETQIEHGADAFHRLAVPRVHLPDGRRGPGLHPGPGVRLYAGPEENEIADPVDLPSGHVAGQHHRGRRQSRDPERRRHEQAARRQLLLVLRRRDACDSGALCSPGLLVQATGVHSGRGSGRCVTASSGGSDRAHRLPRIGGSGVLARLMQSHDGARPAPRVPPEFCIAG